MAEKLRLVDQMVLQACQVLIEFTDPSGVRGLVMDELREVLPQANDENPKFSDVIEAAYEVIEQFDVNGCSSSGYIGSVYRLRKVLAVLALERFGRMQERRRVERGT